MILCQAVVTPGPLLWTVFWGYSHVCTCVRGARASRAALKSHSPGTTLLTPLGGISCLSHLAEDEEALFMFPRNHALSGPFPPWMPLHWPYFSNITKSHHLIAMFSLVNIFIPNVQLLGECICLWLLLDFGKREEHKKDQQRLEIIDPFLLPLTHASHLKYMPYFCLWLVSVGVAGIKLTAL